MVHEVMRHLGVGQFVCSICSGVGTGLFRRALATRVSFSDCRK
jgi:hypothetical protein